MPQTYKSNRRYLVVLMDRGIPQLIAFAQELENGAFGIEALMGFGVHITPGDLVFPVAE